MLDWWDPNHTEPKFFERFVGRENTKEFFLNVAAFTRDDLVQDGIVQYSGLAPVQYTTDISTIISQLLHLGKEYPGGYPYFRNKLKNAFMKNSSIKDPKGIDSAIARGEFVIKELEALYMLRKYRALKKRYYED